MIKLLNSAEMHECGGVQLRTESPGIGELDPSGRAQKFAYQPDNAWRNCYTKRLDLSRPVLFQYIQGIYLGHQICKRSGPKRRAQNDWI